ncbi:protein of unknown function [Rhodovastum atsumiense]|nr:protein of unknown function [Rhodovastum atsumiense]
MHDWFHSMVSRHVIADVPEEMDLCLDCGSLSCRDADYQRCMRRLAHAATLRVIRRLAEIGRPGLEDRY